MRLRDRQLGTLLYPGLRVMLPGEVEISQSHDGDFVVYSARAAVRMPIEEARELFDKGRIVELNDRFRLAAERVLKETQCQPPTSAA